MAHFLSHTRTRKTWAWNTLKNRGKIPTKVVQEKAGLNDPNFHLLISLMHNFWTGNFQLNYNFFFRTENLYRFVWSNYNTIIDDQYMNKNQSMVILDRKTDRPTEGLMEGEWINYQRMEELMGEVNGKMDGRNKRKRISIWMDNEQMDGWMNIWMRWLGKYQLVCNSRGRAGKSSDPIYPLFKKAMSGSQNPLTRNKGTTTVEFLLSGPIIVWKKTKLKLS